MIFGNRNIVMVFLLLLLASAAVQPRVNAQDSTPAATKSDSIAVTKPDTGITDTSATKITDLPPAADTAPAKVSDTTKTDKPDTDISVLKNLISFRKIALSVFVLLLTYLFTNITGRLLDTLSEQLSSYRLFIKRIIPIFRILVWIFALYVILEGIFNPPLETIITLAASVGIAVGFASQDILKNIFGGIMIILDRPFQVGDKIEIGGHYGEVTRIGLRSSRIVTPDDSVVAIPNAEIMNKAVSNANSGALDCQVVAEIYLPAHVDINEVKTIAQNAAYSSKYTYLKKPVVVIAVNEIHERQFVLKLRVKAYVLDIRYEFPFKSDMTELILNELNRRNILGAGSPKN